MKKASTIFLQFLIVLTGIGAFAFLLWEPHLEGRNARATLFQIYFNDPFLAYAYTGAIAFFVALHQAFKLLGYVARNEVFSNHAVKALRTIKYCALTIVAFLLGAEAYFSLVQRGKGEDIAGGVMMGLFLIVVFSVVATAATVFEKRLRTAVENKSTSN